MAVPFLTAAAAPLTRTVEAVNPHGERETISLPAERALTVYVDKREVVTLMTLGAHHSNGWRRATCAHAGRPGAA